MPRVDADSWDPDLAGMRVAAVRRDWADLRGRLGKIPDGQERSWLLGRVAGVDGIERWIPAVIEAEPDSALALLVSGARRVSWAWEARTAARAEHVSREQFQTFHERLRVAEEELYEVAEREPGWVAPWYFLQMSGRGLQVGQETARLRFEAAVGRCPEHMGAHQQQLQQMCAKWGGSHEEAHGFARTAMLKGSEGGPLGELVALAHLEHWLELEDGADTAYIRRPDVVAELHEAADRSVRHPAHGRPRGWLHTYNSFAMAFSLAGEKKAAAELFHAIEGRVTEFPWQYLGNDATKVFGKWRDKAGG
ncbi:hypothetical protein [Streptomyces sp. NPDC006645]|uniref:hypothetical protein n=1 Tax=unclassified Streptomyces TaxID=2593676 RepID=UPI0033B22F66